MRSAGKSPFLGAAAACLAVAVVASTHDSRADDRAAAEAILVTVPPGPADEAVRQARFALERATRMHMAGDDPHAQLAEGLALEWAEAARDTTRTAEVEAKAHATETAATEATARVEREQALLEEAIARGGRLKAELAKAQQAKEGHADRRDRTAPVHASTAKAAPRGATSGHPQPSASPPAPPTDADAPAGRKGEP